MEQVNPVKQCTVCNSIDNRFYISTKAMMHIPNQEEYTFNLCNSCQNVFLINPVKETQLNAFYQDYYLPYRGEKAWGKYAHWVVRDDLKLNKKRVRLSKKYLPDSKFADVLDIGCGKPDFLALLDQCKHIQVTGIDFTSAHWQEDKYKQLNLKEGNWMNMQIDSSFDLITAWHYFEHDYDIQSTVARCYELLNPGGVLIVEVPMYQGFLQKIQTEYWQGWHTPRHIQLFGNKSWRYLFKNEKWRILAHKKYGSLSAFTLWWLGFRERRKTQWNGSMEHYFWNLVFFKIILFPLFVWERIIPMGIQTIIVQKK